MKQRTSLFNLFRRIEGLPVAFVLVILYSVFMVTSPEVFSGYRIYMSFLQTVPPQLVLALGLTLVITAGEIDLSFPAVVAFAGFIYAWSVKTFDPGWGSWAGLVLAIASGALVGYINGILVARIHVPSIMATLATQFFWYGVTVLLAGGLSWNIKGIQTDAVHSILVGRLFGIIPAQALWALALTVFLWFILNRHKFGESVMFIGDNPEVARVMGINVEATKVRLFTLNGMIAAFSALLLTNEMTTFYPTQGGGFLLPVMAAVFIGGTSIAGGLGSIVGTFFGAYIIGSLEAGVVATGISGYWVQLVEGIVMGLSVTLNVLISEGRLSVISDRLEGWTKPVQAKSNGDVLRNDDLPLH